MERQQRLNLIAITREVSPSINKCELTFHGREPIDVAKAIEQHSAYEILLAELGCEVISLPAEPDLPDAVFVEDPVVVVDEVAVISNMGAPSRRPEARMLVQTLSRFRPIKFLTEPATLDGGDVMHIGRSIFVGLSKRTNEQGITQLREILRPHGYEVQPIEVTKCLHLKTACSFIGRNTILVNRSLIDDGAFHDFEKIDVPVGESHAGNALLINDVVIMAESFPKTRAQLEQRGFDVLTINQSELEKAEAGVTCSSVIFNDGPSAISSEPNNN